MFGLNSKPFSVDKPPKNNTNPSENTGVRARPGGAPVNRLLSVVDVKLQLDQGRVHLLHLGVPPGTLPFSLHYLALNWSSGGVTNSIFSLSAFVVKK